MREIRVYSASEIRRNRIIFAAILIALLILIVLGLRACVGAIMGMSSDEQASVAASNVAAQAESQSAQSAEASSEASEGDGESEQSASSAEAESAQSESVNSSEVNPDESEDLRWRDTDFAVDRNRQDWNYEPNGRKVVYLTIDDGPSENTQAVLDILDQYGCKATFFVVGHNSDYFHLIKEAYNRGHTIGLHTLTHDYAYLYSSVDAYYEDLNGIAQIVKDQIGYVPCFIRFPGGSSNTISGDFSQGIMTALTEDVQAAGYQYFDWNVSSGDGSDLSTQELIDISCAPNEYDNIVLLMHDSATKQTSVEALPHIIEHYQSLGYTFEAIDRSTMITHHGVNN